MDRKINFEAPACMPGKIKVSARLVACTIELLENIDFEELPSDCLQLYGYVLHAFGMKKAKLESRGACAGLDCGQGPRGRFGGRPYCHLQAGGDDVFFDRK